LRQSQYVQYYSFDAHGRANAATFMDELVRRCQDGKELTHMDGLMRRWQDAKEPPPAAKIFLGG
jgi:hypothetical protein